MPGLLRGIARTAAIAGTATAVSNRVSRRQAGRWAQQEESQAAPAQGAYAAPAPPAAAAPPPPAASSMDDKISQLKELGELKAQGVLTESEFEAQKTRILNS
ncbi:SHOCT domain-containing protein [Streptomyces sp. Je 1-79]|uniref:SHOCT domain-containing protein n=1 Tax=Streptomyces sp. Je 1-79 TaxID=2943847 RepID=UPI0021A3DB22|nr:SHOCT domain-containing protein [Streptomyces sp. Je 1-79]MCT4353360.1 SHOCT domain-containing protein [Streptomyces sp. Je 1-79]